MSSSAPARRVGIFVIPPIAADAGHLYRRTIEAGRAVESAGLDAFWLAEGHFTHIGVSSSLTVLAALAQATSRIDLGTAVIPIAFDQPLRLAEVAATVHALSGGRLQLGVGKGNGHGFSAAGYEAFGLTEDDREGLYTVALAELRAVLTDGGIVDGRRAPVFPPPGDLPRRLWQATSTTTTAVAAARAGDGLQLHRVAFGADTGIAQHALVAAYLSEFRGGPGQEPRIAASRGVFAASSRADALERIDAILAADPDLLPLAQPGQSAEDYVAASNTHVGSPADIAASLHADPAARAATDVLLAPVLPVIHPDFRGQLRALAGGVAPRLRAEAPAALATR
ncbi:LLM class flavin-dependent oxidoreductase [Microbacterium telephonicum]|uniref:Alkanesulfonate monooxygenase SsuD/methylene tetrahydromethanopterin reductase-like flavin-dependent oxidoreductase (Luciferase family) n=1 Tax=Microbacterium telephonicum TaxID=1714841 RepID=A0A498C9R3_9MICO|nr:LLM class flavin-dependent oxidoreductase [Microbacterium telephonicum]RLK52684.1 alkanesulfonate monooxygenase SsuD/methylene tetrahydromethanopterin reductase-like flavin-dependent oxidoreductase (luciferase family) [Microbacterium telephonicum]